MNKKIYFVIIIFFLICLAIFIFFTYKNTNLGNNISKSDEFNILNISSYEAIAEIEVYSNKNTNKYVLRQKYFAPNIFMQEIIEPENLKGFKTTYDGKNLIIQNQTLNLQTFYENYECLKGNSLSLISFIEQYKESQDAEITQTNEEKIIKVKLNNNNKYEKYKKLYINTKTNLPTKIEILDINENRTVYILYREIRINKTSKDEVLAKK